MNRVCVIDLPALSHPLLNHVPPASALGRWLAARTPAALTPCFPAVTCSMQATLTTGVTPARHGIIANGLATFRDTADADLTDPDNHAPFRRRISFWEQSNQFLQSPRFWQDGQGKSRYPTALLFFQHAMPGFRGPLRPAADIVLTPKPDHGPDGKLTSLCWSHPADLVPQLFAELGPFPLMNYWGPMAAIPSSRWIASAAAKVWRDRTPQLQLTYVPHLDYDLQRFGPDSPQAFAAVQAVAEALDPLIEAVLADGGRVVVLSEYAIESVDHSIPINQWLAAAGLLRTTELEGDGWLDLDRSEAVTMVDHQIAHLYAKTPAGLAAAREILNQHHIETLDRTDQESAGINHPRSGDLIAIAPAGGWFDYRWWRDDAHTPRFARTVDIHRKPGYDPLELFFDPAARAIRQDATLVRGSHGRCVADSAVFISDSSAKPIHATEVAAAIERLMA